jgi:hypothetical protein
MKKIIRLTESQLINLVKRVIKEEFDPKTASYYFNPSNDVSTYTGMFFVKEGNSYRPWVGVKDNKGRDQYTPSKYLVPKITDITAELDNSLKKIILPEGSLSFEANEIYRDFFGQQAMGIVVLSKEGVPTKGVISFNGSMSDVLLKSGKKPVPYAAGNTIQYGKSFFLISKPKKNPKNPEDYGKGGELGIQYGTEETALTV